MSFVCCMQSGSDCDLPISRSAASSNKACARACALSAASALAASAALDALDDLDALSRMRELDRRLLVPLPAPRPPRGACPWIIVPLVVRAGRANRVG